MAPIWIVFAFCMLPSSFGYDWKQYEGYKQVSVVPDTSTQVSLLRLFARENQHIDFWSEPTRVGSKVTMLVSPHDYRSVVKILETEGLGHVVDDEDVSRRLEAEWIRMESKDSKAYDYADFNTYEDVMVEIDNLASQCHPDLTCTTSVIGTTLEGRDIKMLEIKKSGTPNSQAIWIDSAIHAREWLSPATTMNIFREMITTYPTGDNTTTLMSFNWYYVPIMNPDGYTYTFSDDRYWRKNRRDNAGSTCVGVDLNRNYDVNWSEPGADPEPCSNTYHGPSAASELETQAVQNKVLEINGQDNLEAFWTVHTYGQYMLHAFGNCTNPPESAEITRVTTLVCDAIEGTYNTNWDCGNMCDVLYQTSGTTSDWARAVPGIIYSWTPELRGNDFDVPASEIPLSFAEMYNGLKALALDRA